MQEAADRWEKRRLLPREVAGEKQAALRESTELKYQMRLLFKLLGKQDEAVRGVCDDDAWVMQQFAEMLHVPRYALIKTCPRGHNADFGFHPLIYEEKVYYKVSRYIRVTNCNDDSLITTLTGHTDIVCCLIIDDGKLYSGSLDNTIKIWNCSTDTLIKTLTGHTDDVLCLTINDGKLYSGSEDKTIKVWSGDLNFKKRLDMKEGGHKHSVNDAAIIDDQRFVTCGDDSKIIIWKCDMPSDMIN